MGRMKIQLKKIEQKNYRHISFAKRKDGLVKKAYELSTLCDVEVALVLFSPAGKLVLFDGKKRIEDTIKRYIDLPQHQRGNLANEEMICRLASQMSIEADLWHRLSSSGNSVKDRRMIDIQLERIQNQIGLRNIELEDVEKQLDYYVKSPTCIRTITSAEYHESILEDAMKRVSLRKQVLKEKQIASQILSPQTTTTFMMGSPSYGLGWPQQNDQIQFLATNFSNPTGFQPQRNESESFAEMFPSSMAFHGTAGYLAEDVVNGDSDSGQSSMGFHGTGYQAESAVSGGSNQLAPSMGFHGTGCEAGNAVNGGSNHLAPSMGFHGAGYQAGNAVHGGSNQLAPSMWFHGAGYQPGNGVHGGSNQLAPYMRFHGVGYQPENAVCCGSNQLAPSMGFHGAGYQPGNAVHDGSNQLATSMGFHGAGCQPENAVHGCSNQLAPSMEFHGAGNAVHGGSNQPTPSMGFHGAGYLAGNVVNNNSDQFGYGFSNPPEYGWFFNGNFAPWMNNMQQGIRTTPMTSGPSQVMGNVA